MSKLCENCGKELDDDSKVCMSCGTFQNTNDEAHFKKLRVKFTLPKIVFCIIIIAATVGIFFLNRDLNRDIYDGGGYEIALENTAAYMNGKEARLKSLAPREYWERLSAESVFDIDSYLESIEAAEAESTAEPAETEEAPYRFSFKVNEEKQIKGDELRSIDAAVKKLCGVTDDDELVIDAYLVKCTFIAKRADEEIPEDREILSVRIRGTWYPMEDGKFTVGY